MGKVVSDLALDGTDRYGYSEEIRLGRNKDGLAFYIDVDDDASSFAVTITLQACVVGNNDRDEAAASTASSSTSDTGWVDLGTDHGWDGFPTGITGGDVAIAQTIYNCGFELVRLKFDRTAGTGTINSWVSVKRSA